MKDPLNDHVIHRLCEQARGISPERLRAILTAAFTADAPGERSLIVPGEQTAIRVRRDDAPVFVAIGEAHDIVCVEGDAVLTYSRLPDGRVTHASWLNGRAFPVFRARE